MPEQRDYKNYKVETVLPRERGALVLDPVLLTDMKCTMTSNRMVNGCACITVLCLTLIFGITSSYVINELDAFLDVYQKTINTQLIVYLCI